MIAQILHSWASVSPLDTSGFLLYTVLTSLRRLLCCGLGYSAENMGFTSALQKLLRHIFIHRCLPKTPWERSKLRRTYNGSARGLSTQKSWLCSYSKVAEQKKVFLCKPRHGKKGEGSPERRSQLERTTLARAELTDVRNQVLCQRG